MLIQLTGSVVYGIMQFVNKISEIGGRVIVRTKHFILFALIALSIFMFAACKNEPATNPDQGSITCYLNGVVYDWESDQPIKGAKVSLGDTTVETSETGTFLIKDVASGTYTVMVTAEGYYAETKDIVVDSGRFAAKDLKLEELKADELELILDAIDEAEPNGDDPIYEIKSIGDANYYGQSIAAFGMLRIAPAPEPQPAPKGVLEGYVGVRFEEWAETGNVYQLDEGTRIFAVEFDDDDEVYDIFDTTLNADGTFKFEGLADGAYRLFVDIATLTYEGVTVEFDEYTPFGGEYFVINESGKTGNLYIYAEESEEIFGPIVPVEIPFEILSIRAVDRSELPIDAARIAFLTDIKAGGGLCIEFSKLLDEDNEWTLFTLYSEDVTIVGETQYAIINDYEMERSYVYVWNDNISAATVLNLEIRAFSLDEDDDPIFYDEDVLYSYPLQIAGTNLYEYGFTGKLLDYVFPVDTPIVIIFDNDIPEGAFVEGAIYENGKEVEFEYEISGNVLVIDADIKYNHTYDVYFKITSAEGVVIYRTEDNLLIPVLMNLLFADEDGDAVEFNTQSFEVEKSSFKTIEIPVEPYEISLAVLESVYNPELFFDFNQSVAGYLEDGVVLATLQMIIDEQTEKYGDAIVLDCKTYLDDSILWMSIESEEKVGLFAGEYKFTLEIIDSGLNEVYSFNGLVLNIGNGLVFDLDDEFSNGLESFKVANELDHDDHVVEFTWDSEGNELGTLGFGKYAILAREYGADGWHVVGDLIPEKESYEEYYYNPSFDVEYYAIEDDLGFGNYYQFILVTFDDEGMLIQSPVQVVRDEVAPELSKVVGETYIEPGQHAKGETFVLTAVYDESLLKLTEDDVEVIAKYAGTFSVSWELVTYDPQNGDPVVPYGAVKFTVTLLKAVNYSADDLNVKLTVADTSGNVADKITIDFKQH